jgi:hypothetical protein
MVDKTNCLQSGWHGSTLWNSINTQKSNGSPFVNRIFTLYGMNPTIHIALWSAVSSTLKP